MTAVQTPSAPTRVTDSPKAFANDALMRLVGLHGSINARISKSFTPLLRTMPAVGKMLKALCCSSDVSDVVITLEAGVAGDCRRVTEGRERCDDGDRDRGLVCPCFFVGRGWRELRDSLKWRRVW